MVKSDLLHNWKLFIFCFQLRYPNFHTCYFAWVLIHLFADAGTDAVREQIAKVLLERLIVNKPHPWGTLLDF